MSRKTKRPSRNVERDARVAASDSVPAELRIIGGTHRGRKLTYLGDPRTRPMKDRVREAVFNLVGPAVKGKHVFDLFAGTGSIGLEALSRGAAQATFLERHFPTADLLRQNAAALDLSDRCEVVPGDAFAWAKRLSRNTHDALQAGSSSKDTTTPSGEPPAWLVFVSPNWDLFVERPGEMTSLVGQLLDQAPPGSVFVVEADQRFDLAHLPRAEQWDVCAYPPAVIAILGT